jgi:hypothetical protein
MASITTTLLSMESWCLANGSRLTANGTTSILTALSLKVPGLMAARQEQTEQEKSKIHFDAEQRPKIMSLQAGGFTPSALFFYYLQFLLITP